jgi:rhodanese-related sulfurtransferase
MKCKLCISLLALTFFLASCAQQNSNLKTINAQAFKVAIEKNNAQILDVRTASEYQDGHIKNALQANWNDNAEFESRTAHLDKAVPVYVYCLAGGRSAAAGTYLAEKGFNVINLEGGMSNWKMNNLEVEGNANVTQMRVADFEKVIKSNKLVLVDIGATWCPPCRKMLPVVSFIKNQFGNKLYFLAVDGGIDLDVMKHVQFEALPTFIIYKEGKEVWRKTGIVEQDEFLKILQ